MVSLDRNRVVTMRVSDAEHAMLTRIAEEDGVSASDVLRMLLRRSYAERFPGTKKTKPKK